jgi:hypothetical protein
MYDIFWSLLMAKTMNHLILEYWYNNKLRMFANII